MSGFTLHPSLTWPCKRIRLQYCNMMRFGKTHSKNAQQNRTCKRTFEQSYPQIGTPIRLGVNYNDTENDNGVY